MRRSDFVLEDSGNTGIATQVRRWELTANDEVAHLLETLEPRLLLSSTPGSDSALLPVVSSAWFADLTPSSYSVTGGSALLSEDPRVKTMDWQGQEVEVLSEQWIVQLTQQAIEQVGSLDQVQMMLDLGPLGAQVIQGLGMEGLVLIETDAHVDQSLFASALKSHELVAAIEPNLIIHAQLTPNDALFSQLWGLRNTGGSGGTAGADISALQAWDITTGSHEVVVAVIDTGVDFNHPDLIANMWVNPGEIGNNQDSDGNGFIDDIHGYDFVNGRGTPMDDNGHGTHVAGIIGAVGNNGTGVTGVNWSVSIMALKFLNASGSGFISNAVRALNYATMMKTEFDVNVVVTNNSWGGGSYNSQLFNAIQAGQQAGILFVAAAGNSGLNNDVAGAYPANYNLNNVISVAASDRKDELAVFSNYGANKVHIAAPGVGIRSTVPGGYASFSGTSMAAPHVAGVAALLYAANPDLTYLQVKDAILNGADAVASLAGKVATGGRLNAHGALMQVYQGPAPDRYESNDSALQVDTMPEGGVNSPNLGLLTSPVTITNLNTYDQSEDWFKFSMNHTGGMSNHVSIAFDHSQGNLDLAVYRADGTLLGQSTSATNNESVSLNAAAAGTYYVRIWSPNNAQNNYNLTIDPGVNLADAYESNGSRAAVDARPEGAENSPNLGPLTGVHVIENLNTLDGSEDWFRFRLQNNGKKKHKVEIQFDHALGDLDLVVYRADGSIVGRSQGVGNREVVSLRGEPRGVYYIRVYGYNGAKNPDYSLHIHTPNNIARDKAGNTEEEARRLKNPKFRKVHKDFVGYGDEADYYRINLTKARNNLNLQLVDQTGSASVRLINEDGELLGEGVTAANGALTFTTPLTRGVYYVVVEADPEDYAHYNLRIGARGMTVKQWNLLFADPQESQAVGAQATMHLAQAHSHREALATMNGRSFQSAAHVRLLNAAGQVLGGGADDAGNRLRGRVLV